MARAPLSISEYYFAAGTPFPAALAQAVGKEMMALRDTLGHGPRDRDVLEWARAHPKSALFQCFDWNEQAAAQAHWLRTAGDVLRAIRVRIVIEQPTKRGPESVVIETRLMHHVTSVEPGLAEGKVYLPATETLASFAYRTQLIESALTELDRWQSKYSHFKELDIFLRKLEEANREMGRKGNGR